MAQATSWDQRMTYKKLINLLAALSELYPFNLKCAYFVMKHLQDIPTKRISEETLFKMMPEGIRMSPSYFMQTMKILTEQKFITKHGKKKFWYRLGQR